MNQTTKGTSEMIGGAHVNEYPQSLAQYMSEAQQFRQSSKNICAQLFAEYVTLLQLSNIAFS